MSSSPYTSEAPARTHGGECAAKPPSEPVLWDELLWITTRIKVGSRTSRWLQAAAGRARSLTVCTTHRAEEAPAHNVNVIDMIATPSRIRCGLESMRTAAESADAIVVQGPSVLYKAAQRVLNPATPLLHMSLRAASGCENDAFSPAPVADTATFRPVATTPRPTTRVITHGRAVPESRWIELLEIFALAAQSDGDLELEIASIGPQHDSYLSELRRLRSALPSSIGARINFVSCQSQKQVSERLKEADIYLDVAGDTALTRALLEALSCALPVLTNNSEAKRLSDQLPGVLPLGDVETPRQICRNALYLQSSARHPMDPRLLAASHRYVMDQHSFAAFAEQLHRATSRADTRRDLKGSRGRIN